MTLLASISNRSFGAEISPSLTAGSVTPPPLLAGGPWWFFHGDQTPDAPWQMQILIDLSTPERPLSIAGNDISPQVHPVRNRSLQTLTWRELPAASNQEKWAWRGHDLRPSMPEVDPTQITGSVLLLSPGAWPSNKQLESLENPVQAAVLVGHWPMMPRFGALDGIPFFLFPIRENVSHAQRHSDTSLANQLRTRRSVRFSNPDSSSLVISRDLRRDETAGAQPNDIHIYLTADADWQQVLPDLAVAAHQQWDLVLGPGNSSSISGSVAVRGGQAEVISPNETVATTRLLSFRPAGQEIPATLDQRWRRSDFEPLMLAWSANSGLVWWQWDRWRPITFTNKPVPAHDADDDPWSAWVAHHHHADEGENAKTENNSTTTPPEDSQQLAHVFPHMDAKIAAWWADWPLESWHIRLTSRTRLKQTMSIASELPVLLQRLATIEPSTSFTWLAEQEPSLAMTAACNRCLLAAPELLRDSTVRTAVAKHGTSDTLRILMAHRGRPTAVPAWRTLLALAQRDDMWDLTHDEDLRLRWLGQVLLSPHLSPDHLIPLAERLLNDDRSSKSLRNEARRAYRRHTGQEWQAMAITEENNNQ